MTKSLKYFAVLLGVLLLASCSEKPLDPQSQIFDSIIEKNEFEIGEKFKISIPIENLINTGNFTINAETTIESKPILYGKTTTHDTQYKPINYNFKY